MGLAASGPRGGWQLAAFLALTVVVVTGSSGSRAQPGAAHRDEAEDAQAVESCRAYASVPVAILRRAILRVVDRRLCAASDALAGVVSDAGVDGSTRALAALSLGELACHRDSSVRGPARTRNGLSASA